MQTDNEIKDIIDGWIDKVTHIQMNICCAKLFENYK